MRSSGAAFVRAVTALVLGAALVLGVPVLLVTVVGNPFPSEVPTLQEVRILLTQNGQGFAEFLLSSLAVFVWVLWAQLLAALVVEVVATARRTETRRLRVVPGLQGFAARLIAAVTLATMLTAGPVAAPIVGALSFDDISQVLEPPQSVIDVRHSASVIRAGQASELQRDRVADDAPMLTVHEHTELWDLADAAYGDGVSWKRIAHANAGRLDASGRAISAETEAVASGTKLVLPGPIDNEQSRSFGLLAGGPTERQAQDGAGANDEFHRVAPGDSMWNVAEREVADQLGRAGTQAEVADYWADLVAFNQETSSGNADMIYPGETLVLPANGEAIQARTREGTADAPREHGQLPVEVGHIVPDGPIDARSTAEGQLHPFRALADEPDEADEAPESSDVVAPQVLPAAHAIDTSDGSSSSAPAIGLVALGTAMLSAGVVGALRRRRDAQRRTRPAGTIAPASSPESAAFEAALLYASHELQESGQGLGWRALPASAVTTLRASTSVEVHASSTGQFVAAKACSDIDEPQTDTLAAPAVPAVTTSLLIGTELESGDAVLLDLMAATSIELLGSVESIRRFVRTAVLDLAVSNRANDICVVAVSAAEELADLDRVHTVASCRQAVSHIIRTGNGSVHESTPVVVLSAVELSDEAAISELLAAGATLIAPGIQSAASIRIDHGRGVMQPSGTVVALAAFDDQDYRSVAELVEATSASAIELVDPALRVDEVLDVTLVAECPIEPGPIEVKILGPVEVRGAAPFSSLKAVDVVAYLAFHRQGVDADQIKTWVWPPFDPPTDKAFANVMSRARTGLGAGEDGQPYLSRAGADKTYRLDPIVTTDFDRVRALGELAERSDDPAARLQLLKQALDLIRGVPFTGGTATSFAWSDNHVRAQVEYTIDELVHRCADLALELGDLTTARWAALKGLELVPGCEQCFRRRFLIAGAGNNRSELRRAMADLEAAAMIDLGEPEAVDCISGELIDLYNQLDRALLTGSA